MKVQLLWRIHPVPMRMVGSTLMTVVTTVLMEGALELAEAGVRSSIYPDNRQIITGDLPDIAQADLMFDPQTGGGLLAAVEPSTAAALGDGYWVIGRVTQEPGIRFLTS